MAPPAAGGRSDLASIVAAADKLGSRAEERARQTKPEAEEQSASEVAPDSSDESASEAEPDSSSEPKAEAVVESSPPAEPEPVVEPDSESGASSESELPVQQTGHSLPLVFARPEEVMVGMLERTAEVLSEEASNDAVVPVAGPAYPAADTAAAPNGVWTVDLTGHADRPTVNGEAIITDDRPPLPQRRTLTLAESSAEGVTGPPGPPASPRSLRPEEVPHSGEGELASVGAGSVPVPTAYPGPEADPHPKPKPAAPAAAVGGAVSPGPGAAVSSGSTPEPDGSSGSGGRGDG